MMSECGLPGVCWNENEYERVVLEMKTDYNKLERAFNPRCVVVVGDKAESGYMWLHGQSEFKGKLYSVQVDPKEIEGIKALGVENFTMQQVLETRIWE